VQYERCNPPAVITESAIEAFNANAIFIPSEKRSQSQVEKDAPLPVEARNGVSLRIDFLRTSVGWADGSFLGIVLKVLLIIFYRVLSIRRTFALGMTTTVQDIIVHVSLGDGARLICGTPRVMNVVRPSLLGICRMMQVLVVMLP
jgi:hypothetical protein